MKIAFITEYTEIGGGESNLLNLIEELDKKSINITVFCSGRLKIEVERRNIKTIHFSTKKRWIGFFPLLPYNNNRIKKQLEEYDIIHAYSVNVLPYLIGIRPKVIWTAHGFWEKPNGLRSKVIDKIVDRVICVSTDVYNICSFELKKKQIIFLGTNLNSKEMQENTNFNSNNVKLTCIGRFQKIKGQDLLVSALQKLAKKYQNINIELSVIGDVNGNNLRDIEYKKYVLDKVKSYNQKNLTINFLGFRTEIEFFIKKSNIIIIPSRYESFSMVAIEALSCGKPIVGPNTGGLKDIITSEKIGILFEPDNVNSLEDAIYRAIVNFKEFDSRLAIERADFFSIKNQALKHICLYKEVLDE
ncbi:hypothetical protein JL12_00925 [Gallibacterium anatis 10672-6]|uniref:glycosyltransferase family 4 protein n=1 Tax=Gallibacterium anatis TaxID=750 RepID=UPI0005319C07|nr:glycosyltransferase family 4 protein [Gallibacterium anatis]KGQ52461.1 hypothetical protein JL12_00925 [Gallibacterium anatis 10672-6]